MSLNTGTLIGAVIKTNDSLDQYPVADANDVQGGSHSVNTNADMQNMGAWLREAGMTCYVIAEGNTYQLAADLSTWKLLYGTGGGTTAPGSGGTNNNILVVSGNFGDWTLLGDGDTGAAYKIDMAAFTNKIIGYITGQFNFTESAIPDGSTAYAILGNLPQGLAPAVELQQFLFLSGSIGVYLQVDTTGVVSLQTTDGSAPPLIGPAGLDYFLNLFFELHYTPPRGGGSTNYTSTRTENFTRNNCGSGSTGSVVSYSQDYTSTVDQATADSLAASDPNYEAAGQAYANDPANGGTCTVGGNDYSLVIKNNSSTASIIGVNIAGPENYQIPGIGIGGAEIDQNIGAYTYTKVLVGVGNRERLGSEQTVTVNGISQSSTEEAPDFTFENVAAPIEIFLD